MTDLLLRGCNLCMVGRYVALLGAVPAPKAIFAVDGIGNSFIQLAIVNHEFIISKS